MEKETLTHTWVRSAWCDEAEAQIGHLIEAERAAILADIEAGLSFLFHVTGPLYGGWVLFRFYEDHKGRTLCYCPVFHGHNTQAGLPYLAELVRNAGAVELICDTEQEAVARLYRRQGWRIENFRLVLDL